MVKELKEEHLETEVIEDITDENLYSFDFLVSQIKNAFEIRESSPLVKKLPFREFCETTLPYNFVTRKYVSRSGEFFNKFFSKYIGSINDDRDSIIENIKRYNITISNFKKILGRYPVSRKIGFEEMLFNLPFEKWDCFDWTNFGALILNACGIPVKIEYNVTGKLFAGSHSTGTFPYGYGLNQFTFESTVPNKINGKGYWRGLMNFYQLCFEAQLNTPFFVKNEDEVIPRELSSPLIKDMSHSRVDTTTMILPFDIPTSNNLAYLATFNRISGTSCTSWGVIDKTKKSVTFEGVIPGTLYFPVYYEGEDKVLFAAPFYLKIDTLNGRVVYNKTSFDLFKKKILDSVFIKRKFPEKVALQNLAKGLVGTMILASDSSDFSNADTVYVLDYEPKFVPQDVILKTSRAYKFYRIVAPTPSSRITIAEVQFLTKRSFGYNNTIEPMSFYRFDFKDKAKPLDSSLVRIVDNIDLRWPLNDGNVETSARNNYHYTQQFSKPLLVTHLRIIPLNANNGIVPGNKYILYDWDNGRWNEVSDILIAKDQFLFFEKLETNRIYWLKNISAGREEAPFILDESGKQHFFYSDIFNELRWM